MLFVKMEKEPELTLNKYYQGAIKEEKETEGFAFASLLSKFDLQAAVVA